MKTRQLEDRVERYSKIIKGRCSCGERVDKVLDSNESARRNNERYCYPKDNTAWGIFRCKTCRNPIDETFTAGVSTKGNSTNAVSGPRPDGATESTK